jgi:hypothetical protein
MAPTLRPASGILALTPEMQKIMRLRKQLIPKRELPVERARQLIPQLSALPGLAPTDPGAQLGEASQMAKLQLGLALASRGFGSMGAQPRPGEMAISTLGREMLAPLGADAMTVAQRLYDQKLKLTAAEKAQKAAISQAALAAAQEEQRGDISFIEQLMLKIAGKTPLKSTIKVLNNLQIFRDGSWVDSPGISVTDPTSGNTIYHGPDNEVLRFVKGPNDEAINARIFETAEGSKFETSESRGIEITPKTIDFVKNKFGAEISKDLIGKKAFIQTYNPKGDFPDLKSFSKIQIGGQSFNLSKPIAGQTITPTELSNMSKIWVDPSTDTYTGHFVVVNSKTGKPVFKDGRRVDVSKGPGNKLYMLGTTVPYVPGTDTKVVGADKIDAAKATETDAQRATEDRVGMLYSTMGQIQVGQHGGLYNAYNARAALYFDPAAFLANKFPFKYIPPGTDINDRSRDVIITNKEVQDLATNKMRFLANTVMKSNYGEVNQTVKTARIADAVKQMLSIPPSTLFGAEAIEKIGTDVNGNPVGYTPDKAALSSAARNIAAKTAMSTMRTNPDANAVATFAPIAIPDNKAALRSAVGRMRIATEVFPTAFSNTGEAWSADDGTDLYDSQLVQRRLDIEKVLMDAPLGWNASPEDHRALIQKLASKKADARNTQQNSRDARLANESFGLALEFRDALLSFKNAAAHTGVEGFFTGTLAKIVTRIGFADWLLGDEGAEHMTRLAIASERFQEGISRRVGKDFGDDRISNLDAAAYKKLVADISSGAAYNKILIKDGLRRVGRDLTDLMAYGGKVGWTERDLERAAEAGVDFSALNTQMNWHGYGYYGKSRYPTSRQYTPALSDVRRNDLRAVGELKDTMYGGEYTVPLVNYLTDQLNTFSMGKEATDDGAAVKATETLRMGPAQFDIWLEERAGKAGVSREEMRRRAVRGIRRYNIYLDTLN